MTFPDPIPPPVANPQPPFIRVNPYEPSRVINQAAAVDLSATDGRTVAALVSLAIALTTFVTCYLLGPIPPAAGLMFAVFAKPSKLRTAALIGNGVMLAVSILFVVMLFWDIASDPYLR